MDSNKKISLRDLGLRDYKHIWEYQTSLLDGIIAIKIGGGSIKKLAEGYVQSQ